MPRLRGLAQKRRPRRSARPWRSRGLDEPLLELKLWAARSQDIADAVALLKRLDDIQYNLLEAYFDRRLTAKLWGLRKAALEELSWGE